MVLPLVVPDVIGLEHIRGFSLCCRLHYSINMVCNSVVSCLPLTLRGQTLEKGTGKGLAHGGTGIDISVPFNFFQEPPN